jgi:CheY-like chemotaxis protein
MNFKEKEKIVIIPTNLNNDNNFIKVEIRNLLKKMVKIFQIMIFLSQKPIEILVDIDNNIPFNIYTDPNKLNQILYNIFSNSFKFTKIGTITVILKYFPEENFLQFIIEDTGCGIKSNIIAHILKPFYKSGDNNIYGLGIGLYIVKKNVEYLKGKIFIESIENFKTKVTFSININGPNNNEINKNNNNNILINVNDSPYIPSNNTNTNISNKLLNASIYHLDSDSPQNMNNCSYNNFNKTTKNNNPYTFDSMIGAINNKNYKYNDNHINNLNNENDIDCGNKYIKVISRKNSSGKILNNFYNNDESKENDRNKIGPVIKINNNTYSNRNSIPNPKSLHNIFKNICSNIDIDDNLRQIKTLPTKLNHIQFKLGLSKRSNSLTVFEYKNHKKLLKNIRKGYFIESSLSISSPGKKNNLFKDSYFSVKSKEDHFDKKSTIRLGDNNFIPKLPDYYLYSHTERDEDIDKIINSSLQSKNENEMEDYLNYSSDSSEIFYFNSSKRSKVIKILVVDDEKLIRQTNTNLIKKFFSKFEINFKVTECEDGFDCINKLYKAKKKNINYDFILTDQTMNYMCGTTLCDIVRILCNAGILNKIKIFLVSSYSKQASNNYDKFDMKFSKPLKNENLKTILREIGIIRDF